MRRLLVLMRRILGCGVGVAAPEPVGVGSDRSTTVDSSGTPPNHNRCLALNRGEVAMAASESVR